MKTQLTAVLALASLAACGGSGADGPVAIPNFEGFGASALQDRAREIAGDYEDLVGNEDFTSAGNVPTSGSVAMTGVVGIGDADIDAESGFLGEIALSVDFASSSIEGTAGNFYFIDGAVEKADGELDFNGDISRSTGAVEGTIAGTLTVFDSAEFNTTVRGGFLGNDASAVAASGTETITVDGNAINVEVGFIAD